MILKSFTHISRHAALAKTLWASSGSTTQPAFFATTNQLARQQSQLVVRNNNSFGQSDGSSSSSANPNSYSALCNTSSFSSLSPLSTLDDDKRREAILAEATGSSGSCLIYNHQHSLPSRSLRVNGSLGVRRRRCSTTSLDEQKPSPAARVRRYSVSHTSKSNSSKINSNPTPPSTPVTGPVNVHEELVFSDLTLLKLDNASLEPLEGKSEEALAEPAIPQDVQSQPPSSSPVVDATKDVSDVESHSIVEPSPETRSTPSSIFSSIESSSENPEVIITPEELQYVKFQESLASNLVSAIESGSQSSVVDAYRLFQSNNVVPSLSSYEQTLSFLASKVLTHNHSENLNTVLSIYMDIVSKRISPSSSIYSSVITSLTSLARHTVQHKESNLSYFRLRNRHSNAILPSVKSSLDRGDTSDALYKTALEIFSASNSVHTQRYDMELYQCVLDACLATRDYAQLYPITRMLEMNNCTLDADIFISLINGYGRHGDIKAVVETYKHYKALAGGLVTRKEIEVYASLIGAFFDAGMPDSGLLFLNKVLESDIDRSTMSPVLGEVIKAYCRLGDYSSALTWIQKVESDAKFEPISLDTLVSALSSSCDAGDLKNSQQLFDFIASRTDAQDPAFNISRNDFLTLCVKSNDAESLFKTIKETHLRGGIWELSTILAVSKYLLQLGDTEFAIRTFDIQTQRYCEHMVKSDLPLDGQTVEALNALEYELAQVNQLTPSVVLRLMKCEVFDGQAFSDVNGAGIACFKVLWNAQSEGTIRSLLAEDPHSIIDIVSAHLKWIHISGANNSLGGLSIPTPLLEALKVNFRSFVRHMISISPALEDSFQAKVTEALKVLDDAEGSVEWSAYCDSLKPQAFTQFAPLVDNRLTTNQILLASQNANTIHSALTMLQAAVARNEIIGSEAFVSLIEAAGNAKDAAMIKQVYTIALSSLPRPSEHPASFQTWVPIHRAVVRSANVDYQMAHAAYQHLLRLGVFPDATGYGQLISNTPLSDNHDEATDALWMFNEARSNNVPLNTFLYNVVLSKLSKARRLNDAIFYFNDMDLTNTKKSSVTYGTIISACCRCCDESAARSFFEEMEASPYYTPKIAPFNILLQFYVHNKRDRNSALQIYARLRELGLKPSAHTYKLLIDAYSMIEPINIEAADSVLLSIIADNSAVTTKHYSSLLYARGVSMKNQIAAQEFYNALIMNNRVRPDKNIFQALLETYVVNKSVRSTPGVLKDMISYGVDLDAYMANILIRGWAPVNMDKARGLFNHVLEAGIAEPSSFESIIRAYLYYGDIAAAQDVLNLMVSHLYPQPVVAKIQSLINAHSTPATKLTEDMLLESIFRQDSQALNSVIVNQQQKVKPADNSTLLEVFDSMPSVSAPPSLVDY